MVVIKILLALMMLKVNMHRIIGAEQILTKASTLQPPITSLNYNINSPKIWVNCEIKFWKHSIGAKVLGSSILSTVRVLMAPVPNGSISLIF